jgi:HAD superfamily hydrolase (TIGR01509 family)
VFTAAILDVDGVLVDSPHERAWRETLEQLMTTRWRDLRGQTAYAPDRFTASLYQHEVSGKPRLSGARAALEYFELPDLDARAAEYAELKQRRVTELIEAGEFTPFPDALPFVRALRAVGLRLAVASSSKNAAGLLRRIAAGPRRTLLDCFDADTSGRPLAHGKPHPEIFLAAAEALGEQPAGCFVVEDAIAGVQAAKAAGMAALGLARSGETEELAGAGADLVVRTLDDVDIDGLRAGRLAERRR